ncbi:hypothetical protein J7K24_02250 [bacterium]|nr:hypothetical protein [bacterium]
MDNAPRKSQGLLFFLLLILFLSIFLFLQQEGIVNLFFDFPLQIKEETGILVIKKPKIEIQAPPPLRVEDTSAGKDLTKEGVIEWTNIERKNHSLSPLKENPLLDSSAEMKLQDMFQNQYFAHYSSSGIGVGELVEQSGYEFIVVGENLALGNFDGDQDLVEAWMNSPDHRKNILNTRYQEIGVAVGKGMFEGKEVWIAVQHFGLPLSACPQPDSQLKIKIDTNKRELDQLRTELENLQKEMASLKFRNRSLYRKKVKEYNSLVEQYNELFDETKDMISKYNIQVATFNSCITNPR